ncbi:iron-containing alcohol dehydrogenase [Rhodococcus sp. (in: high G+C Gram-positive bacteria)]|uniref:iron-containing alcohol dehydrogenase n=1 Tax=Rhodococcus sp. TaxID=1831 RepID=UPI00257F89C2|nr:iron-containing alcohol dehydrogenase [Rhodococcus sp. (in: high G+C Gram-positive bacteria)]MBQ9055530.1 iron-containing alcohol dehydrogenase [Rhodococcus sp. (in: high G+C Gram-positive bacteria)]
MSVPIALPRIMRIGAGAVADIGEVVTSLGLSRPLVVTDSFLVGTGAAEQMIKNLETAGLSPRLFDGTVPDPTTASLEAGLVAIREHNSDSVIGFGGGSPMDTAKALGLLGRQGGEMRDYKAPRINVGPALPIIAVPTTAGSGSEATQFTVISDSESDEKMLCPGLAFLPLAAVIDYELTVSMPPRLTADTGVDALTHAIEAYVSKKASPFSDSLALIAIGTIGRVLRRAYTDGHDAEAREQMMLAATQAGIAFSNSSVALVHGMSRPIGAHFHVAHGLSNAMLFPAVTAFSVRAAESRYADCARALGVAAEHDSDASAADHLVEALTDLCRDVEVPTPKAYGIDKARWDELTPLMAEQALASGSPNNNPRVPTEAEIRDLYAQIYG